MRRWLALLLAAAMAFTLLAGCGESGGDATLETIGEGVPTEGKAVFYEFFTEG